MEPAWTLGVCLAVIFAAEAIGMLADAFRPPGARAARREARKREAAERLVRALGHLKGAFAKAGQFASLRHDVVPEIFREALAGLQDRVPPLPFDSIAPVIEQELGRPLAQCFASIDPEPIGAASVAQVHRGALHDGTQVAIKVQYPWLASSLRGDLAVLHAALRIWTRLRDRRSRLTDLDLFFAEFSAGLREELDFEREGEVASEVAANLSTHEQIVVPCMLAAFSSRRVLTMTYHDSVSVTDAEALAELGVEPAAVLEVLARAYAKQIFVDGLFHADPHPGNLLVLREPGAAVRPRIVFVDFGLSKRLSPGLRREMRQGIYALLQRNLDAFIECMNRMGMMADGSEPAVRAAVAQMFSKISADGESPAVLETSGSQILSLKDDAVLLLQETQGLQLPNDLLLYAKTLSYLFTLGQILDPETDLMKISLPYLLRFLAGHEP